MFFARRESRGCPISSVFRPGGTRSKILQLRAWTPFEDPVRGGILDILGFCNNRANAVRDYLIEKGIAPERITTIGYGSTKPAVYEVTPGDINTKEAKANMRVLFEVIVK